MTYPSAASEVERQVWPSAPAIRVHSADDLLEHAVSMAGLGAFDVDWRSATALVTPRLRELFGWTLEQTLTVQDLAGRIHPADRERVFNLIGLPADSDGAPVFSIDFRIVLPDGAVRWITASAQRFFEGEGAARRRSRTVGVVFDATQRMEAEVRLRDSQESLEQATRTAGLGVFQMDWRANTMEASPRLREIYGWGPDECVGVPHILERVHPDDRARVSAEIGRPDAAANPLFAVEHRIVHPDGSLRWVIARARRTFEPDGEGHRRVRTVGAVLDVTDMRLAEAQLRASEERYALFERGVNDGIWDWNILTGEHYHSPRWLEIAGANEDEAPPTDASFFERIHPDDQRRVREALDRHWSAGERYDVEVRLRQSDGSYRWVLSRGEAVRDEAGRPTRMVGALTDISARKAAEEALRRAHDELEQRVQERTRELRDLSANLLTAQEDERRRLARELHDGVTQQLALVSIDVGTIAAGDVPESLRARLQALQAKVVQISHEVRRVSHGLHPALIEDLGLSAALEACCEEHQHAHQTRLRFTGDGGDAGLDIVEASALYRVAQESVANASKHARATRIDVTLRRTPAAIELVIEDDGVGFEPGPRGAAGGLGLVSMAERMRLVSGTLRVVSKPGAGTTVVAAIPVGTGA